MTPLFLMRKTELGRGTGLVPGQEPKPGVANTHPYMQWAAVSTQRLPMREPPHTCSSSICRLTCQGHFFCEAGLPPTILMLRWPHPGAGQRRERAERAQA